MRNVPLVDTPHPTGQQLFDAVCAHAATMPEKSLLRPDTGKGACAYRAPDGNACFIGGLLTDEEADGLDPVPASGGASADVSGVQSYADLVEDGKLPDRLAWMENIDLLDRLQLVHDSYATEHWKFRLAEVAREFNLDAGAVSLLR